MRSRDILAFAAIALITIGSLYTEARYQVPSADKRPFRTAYFPAQAHPHERTLSRGAIPAPILETLAKHGIGACAEAHLEGLPGHLLDLLRAPAQTPTGARPPLNAFFCCSASLLGDLKHARLLLATVCSIHFCCGRPEECTRRSSPATTQAPLTSRNAFRSCLRSRPIWCAANLRSFDATPPVFPPKGQPSFPRHNLSRRK